MKKIFWLCAISFCALAAARGGPPEPQPEIVTRQSSDRAFVKGALEFQDVSGAYFFFDSAQNNRPAIDYAINSLRFGIMLYDPQGPSLLAGNFELMGEIFGGGIFDGPGNVLAGSTLIFRYNFIQPRARIIPYLQVGAGGVYTDIDEAESRGLISLPVEFNLQAISGVRYMLNDRWSLVVEAAYRHVSNAEIKKPNFGLDNIGGNVGFGFSF
ncbi:MAG: acyloxyacyl hydrolase [Chthoniobacterales bacterium]|nr:acyloxyacyl hydrolase [Chthoniobacterales bacterium]